MKRNVGTIDRVLRLVLGAALVITAVFTGIWWLYIIAAPLVITGAIGWCGLFKVFGIKTCTASDTC